MRITVAKKMVFGFMLCVFFTIFVGSIALINLSRTTSSAKFLMSGSDIVNDVYLIRKQERDYLSTRAKEDLAGLKNSLHKLKYHIIECKKTVTSNEIEENFPRLGEALGKYDDLLAKVSERSIAEEKLFESIRNVHDVLKNVLKKESAPTRALSSWLEIDRDISGYLASRSIDTLRRINEELERVRVYCSEIPEVHSVSRTYEQRLDDLQKTWLETERLISSMSEQSGILLKVSQNLSGVIWEKSSESIIAAKDARLYILITFIASILISAGLAVYISRSIIVPVKELTEGTMRIASGNLEHRISVESNDELGGLAEQFNAMSGDLKEAYRKLENRIELVNKDLLVEKERVEAVIENIAEGVLIIDNSRKIIGLNKAGAKMLGLQLSQCVEEKCYEIFKTNYCHRDKDRCLMLKKLEGKFSPFGYDYYVSCNDGSKTPVLISIGLLYNEDGSFAGAVEVFRDITELKEIDQMKADFIANVSHELRTPLTSIIMAVRVMIDKKIGELTEKQEGLLKIVNSDSERLVRLINDLLDLSKMEAGMVKMEFQHVDVYPIIEETVSSVQSIAESKNIKIENLVHPEIGTLYIDPDRIKQVFTNLLYNGLRFTENGGSVSVRAEEDEADVEFSISDTGVGIPKDKQSLIFERYRQLDEDSGGTGLGLAITKNIVEMHNGKIRVESEVGKGSTFVFSLPRVKRIPQGAGV